MRDMADSVVVGFDGSEAAQAALDWATLEAGRRDEALVVLYAANYAGVLVGPAGAATWLPTRAELTAHEIAEQGAKRARSASAAKSVTALVVQSGAAVALIEASTTASLVVVGTRGRGVLSGSVVGSVAFAVTSHATCPAVVVRGDSGGLPGPGRPVVVGVDGSTGSELALDRAAEYASTVGAELRIVTAWHAGIADAWASAYVAESYPGRKVAQVLMESAETVLAAAQARVAEVHPSLDVTTHADEGPSASVLAEASSGAGLLVVGARGRGDFTSLLLGSVSRGVIQLASCPVEVVRE